MNFDTPYSPWDLLPVPEPRTVRPPEDQFYNTVIKHLVPDVIRIMANGIPIDLAKVQELEAEIDKVLAEVDKEIQSNQLIREFSLLRHSKQKETYIQEQRQRLKTPTDFLKPFSCKQPLHRAYLIEALRRLNLLTTSSVPTEEIAPGIPKWSARHVQALAEQHPAIQLYLNNRLQPTNTFAQTAMLNLATDKATAYNAPIHHRIANPDANIELPRFNIASSVQKQEFFDFLGIESEATSKTTGEDSWNRDQIERINKETDDPRLKSLTSSMIDYSFGAIIKQNFIKAFYERSIAYPDCHRLHGSLRLFGAKSFRLTSQNPKHNWALVA